MSQHLVLIGGGHTHVQVLRRWASEPVPGVRLTVLVDRPIAVYSGMVPGFVAGDYSASDLEIDVASLAKQASAELVLAKATRVDAAERRVEVEGGDPIGYDVASLNVGSTVHGLDIPGVREHALATRPIWRFVEETVRRVETASGTPRVAVVGAGAGGVELAFTLEARLRALGASPAVTLVDRANAPLTGYPPRAVKRVLREAERRGIHLRLDSTVQRIDPDAVVFSAGAKLPSDMIVWVTGAAAPTWLADGDLPLDERGFVRVRDTLQVEGVDTLFAVGDCATLVEHPWVPRAGVYAVREGPILDDNLRASLVGAPLRRYNPQREFLTLLNIGDRRAIGTKWGLAFQGAWVWRWKDRIDRRFIAGFR